MIGESVSGDYFITEEKRVAGRRLRSAPHDIQTGDSV